MKGGGGMEYVLIEQEDLPIVEQSSWAIETNNNEKL
jgi:hypothetical protein